MRLVLSAILIMYILKIVAQAAQGINISEFFFYLPEYYLHRYKTISILLIFLVFENWITVKAIDSSTNWLTFYRKVNDYRILKGFLWKEQRRGVHKLCRLGRGGGGQKIPILCSKKTTEGGRGSKITDFEMT